MLNNRKTLNALLGMNKKKSKKKRSKSTNCKQVETDLLWAGVLAQVAVSIAEHNFCHFQ